MMKKIAIILSISFSTITLNAINIDDPYSIEKNIGLIHQAETSARKQAIDQLLREYNQKKQSLEEKLATNDTDRKSITLGRSEALQAYKQGCEKLKLHYETKDKKFADLLKTKEYEFTELELEKKQVEELIDVITRAQNGEDFLKLDRNEITKQMSKESPRGPQESTIECTQRKLTQTLFNLTRTVSSLKSYLYSENSGQ